MNENIFKSLLMIPMTGVLIGLQMKVLAFIGDDMRHLPYDSRRAVVAYES
jgi:hypothetical protein